MHTLMLLLVIVSSLFITSSASAVVPMKSNRIILEGSNWLGGAGVAVYSNDGTYSSNDNDNHYIALNGIAYKTGYRWQCVELVYRLYLSKGWIPLPSNPNNFSWRAPTGAYEMFDNAPANLSRSPQGQIDAIGPGDVLVLSNGGNGHVAVVDHVSGNTVRTVNQNLLINSDQTIQNITWDKANRRVNWSGFTTVGIVHAPGSTSNRSQPFIGTPADGNVVENITPGAGGHYYVAAGGVLF
ncbi:MAG TPA: CHAP domain-containing protein, partial [Candidatus Saccharimonadales bacterium]|nr:CHAP domain-containing protein [Candidatus Saccharimonadales bacterium]